MPPLGNNLEHEKKDIEEATEDENPVRNHFSDLEDGDYEERP